MSGELLTSYRATLSQREADERQAQARRKQQAVTAARRVASWMKRTYGVSRVVLFGSITANQRLGPHSDIDLAVWGLDSERYYEAVARVQDEAAPFTVDLVRIEQCPHSLRKVIETEGVEV